MKQELDLTKYRTEELFETIVDLINIREIYLNSARLIIAVSFVGTAVVGWLFWNRTTMMSFLFILLTSVFVGGAAGSAFAIAEVIRKSIGNMLKIVELMLNVTQQVVADLRALSSGDMPLPSPRELANAVYRDVILPLVERAISELFWVFGKPLLWVYRLTLGWLVRKAIAWLPSDAMELNPTENQLRQMRNEIDAEMPGIEERKRETNDALEKVKKRILNIGGLLRVVVMLPAYAIRTLILCGCMVPIMIGWYLTDP